MEYDVKVIIADTTITDTYSDTLPFISDAVLKSATALTPMAIGSSASDTFSFILHNPPRNSYDGEKVEVYISPLEDTTPPEIGDIEDEVGTDTAEDAIDENDTTDLDDADDSDGEDLTTEEEADVEDETTASIEAEYDFFEGEDDTVEDEDTDEAEEDEWIKLGAFWVTSQVNTDNGISFKCMDAMSQLVGMYTPSSETATVQAMYNDLASQIQTEYGITVDDYPFSDNENIAIAWTDVVTYRVAYERFAGIAGGFATIGADETLGISFYTYNDSILIDTSVLNYSETSSGEMRVEQISCDRATAVSETDVITVGAGQGVAYKNPYVTGDILSDIYDIYKGIRYVGATATISWNDTMQAGEFIRVMSLAEYSNYLELTNALEEEADADEVLELKDNLNSLGKVLLISNMTVQFTGDATAKIQSICEGEYKKETTAETPTDAKFRHLEADTIKAHKIVTDILEANGITATTAVVEELTAATANITNIQGKVADYDEVLAGRLSAEQLSAEYARIDLANINTEWVKTLLIQGQVVAQTGTVYNLIGLHINGDLIEANTLRADRLLLQGANGLYYAINVDALGKTTASSDEKYQKALDGSAIVAHSITADQITANNIIGTGGWINLAEGEFDYEDAGTGEYIRWQDGHLEMRLRSLDITGTVSSRNYIRNSKDAIYSSYGWASVTEDTLYVDENDAVLANENGAALIV